MGRLRFFFPEPLSTGHKLCPMPIRKRVYRRNVYVPELWEQKVCRSVCEATDRRKWGRLCRLIQNRSEVTFLIAFDVGTNSVKFPLRSKERWLYFWWQTTHKNTPLVLCYLMKQLNLISNYRAIHLVLTHLSQSVEKIQLWVHVQLLQTQTHIHLLN